MPIHMPMYYPKSYKCLDMTLEGEKWQKTTKKKRKPKSVED